MNKKEIKNKQLILNEQIFSLITEELGEDVANEVLIEIEELVNNAIYDWTSSAYEDEKEEDIIEYRSNMDDFENIEED